LLTVAKLIAPFVPFLAEAIWRNLTSVWEDRATESVHLTDYPTGNAELIDRTLSEQMAIAREISSLGRSARMGAKLKVRQPLSKVEVILASDAHRAWLEDHAELVRSELNVKQVEYTQQADEYISYQVLPNFKVLGPKLGPLLPKVKNWLSTADASQLMQQLDRNGTIVASIGEQTVELTTEDVQVRLQAKEGWAAAHGQHAVVVLSTELSPQLVREGLARDLVRLIQDRRKELGCAYTDRISVAVQTDAQELRAAMLENRDYIMQETLAVDLNFIPIANVEPVEREVGQDRLALYLSRRSQESES
jgi:isoleucyl-tRNA synthetase